MSEEKVIHEVRVIETEDGFRIEIKGDKERLKEMGFGKGMFPFAFGPMGHGGPFGHHRGHHGHRGFGPFGHGPWGRGPWWGESEHPAEDQPESRA